MTGYSPLDRVMAMAAEHQAKAASYRYLDRPPARSPRREPRSHREPRTHRLGFGGPLLGR